VPVEQGGHGLAAAKDVAEAAEPVEVGGVQGQAARRVRVHPVEEADLALVVDVADARPHPVATLEQRLHDPPADEPGGAGHGNDATLWYCAHRLSSQDPSIR